MKSLLKISFFSFFTFLYVNNTQAQEEPADTVLIVNGVCEMCQRTIEKAALNTKGVEKASWNVHTKVLSLSYDPQKISLEKISENIAKSGYDTEFIAATEEDYYKLHKCCYYRDPAVVESHKE